MDVLARRLASMGLEARLPCARDLLGQSWDMSIAPSVRDYP